MFYSPAIAYLETMIEQNSLAHAYIFSGPDTYGKIAAATALGHALERREPLHAYWATLWGSDEFWKNPTAERAFLDTKIFGGEHLGIDDARAVRDFIIERPLGSDRRVAVIAFAHALTASAQQALLKVSEDAPEYGVLIFIAPAQEQLIGTLASRCANVYFKKPSAPGLEQYLEEELLCSRKKTHEIMRFGRGLPGLCAVLASDKERAGRIQAIVQTVESEALGKVLALCDAVETDDDVDWFFEGLIERVRRTAVPDKPQRLRELIDYRVSCARLGTSIRTQLEAAALVAFKK
jgi:hypothetical protein